MRYLVTSPNRTVRSAAAIVEVISWSIRTGQPRSLSSIAPLSPSPQRNRPSPSVSFRISRAIASFMTKPTPILPATR